MSCEWAEQVALYAGGDADGSEVERHLAACAECRELLGELRADCVLLQEGPLIPEAAVEQVREAVLVGTRPRRMWVAMVAAVAAVTLAGVLWTAQRHLAVEPLTIAVRTPAAPAVSAPPPPQPLKQPLKHAQRRRPTPRAVPDEQLTTTLRRLLEDAPVAPTASGSSVVLTATTADPDVIFVLIGDTQGDLNE